MIAIDTNVLIRYLVRDNPEQVSVADALLEGLTPVDPGFICREVLLETVWVLERVYRFPRAQIVDVLRGLFATGSLVTEASDDVAKAAFAYGQGSADFADLMILAAAERVGATPLYTFDRRLAREEGAALLGAQPF